MIDANALLKRWIAQGLSTDRVSVPVLPKYLPDTSEGFRPEDGPWIVLQTIAGQASMESPLLEAHIQLRVWAGPNQSLEARTRYLEVFDLIHGQTVSLDVDGRVIACEEIVHGQDDIDPDDGYSGVRGIFKLTCITN